MESGWFGEVGECSSGGAEKICDMLAPQKTFHKNSYAPKPNPLKNKFDTTPDPHISSPYK
jgi:hypothetical protein